MKQLLSLIFAMTMLNVHSQQLHIITADKTPVEATLLDEPAKKRLLQELNGKQENSLRKKWTARTFMLSTGKVVIEFYDRQAAVVNNVSDFKKLEGVRFVKNTIDFLKKNISYKIELTYEQGNQLIANEKPKRLDNLKSDMPEYYDFEVYELNTGQILFLNKSSNLKDAAIYPDLKTLSSENTTIQEQVYGPEDDEHLMKKLAAGDALPDYDVDSHSIYPEYLDSVIKNHQLKLIERKVYVSAFYSNLYESKKGYCVTIDEVNQKNGAGNKMLILSLRFYETLQQVKDAQARYREFKKRGFRSEHFYKKVSDKYGENFPAHIAELTNSLPAILNFDKEQLSFDSVGMDIVDEALKWNGTNYALFDTWFPAVLAYYGQCYINEKHDGGWAMYFDKESKVWIPELRLKDGSAAWDLLDFFKGLMEGPIPLRWAGDWDGSQKRILEGLKSANGQ